MSNNLSLEEQKLLTEWLGECWHEDGVYPYINNHLCCGNSPPPDFSDWRVVGRLVERAQDVWVFTETGIVWSAKSPRFGGDYYDATTPQLAICHAILTHLKEKE